MATPIIACVNSEPVCDATKANEDRRNTLVKAGLLANEEKSVWVPSLVVAWFSYSVVF